MYIHVHVHAQTCEGRSMDRGVMMGMSEEAEEVEVVVDGLPRLCCMFCSSPGMSGAWLATAAC